MVGVIIKKEERNSNQCVFPTMTQMENSSLFSPFFNLLKQSTYQITISRSQKQRKMIKEKKNIIFKLIYNV